MSCIYYSVDGHCGRGASIIVVVVCTDENDRRNDADADAAQRC